MNCKIDCRNYMEELLNIISDIKCLKPEPEVCNVRCPPFGCPRGPCPGMCCYGGVCDPCCMSKMPCCPPNPQPPGCCAPPLCALRAYAKAVGYPPESCLSPQNACNQQSVPNPCCPPMPPCPPSNCCMPAPPRPCSGVPIYVAHSCPPMSFQRC